MALWVVTIENTSLSSWPPLIYTENKENCRVSFFQAWGDSRVSKHPFEWEKEGQLISPGLTQSNYLNKHEKSNRIFLTLNFSRCLCLCLSPWLQLACPPGLLRSPWSSSRHCHLLPFLRTCWVFGGSWSEEEYCKWSEISGCQFFLFTVHLLHLSTLTFHKGWIFLWMGQPRLPHHGHGRLALLLLFLSLFSLFIFNLWVNNPAD